MYRKFEYLLEKSNKTTYQVAKDTGISASTFSEWKKGMYVPKLDKLEKIAEYFGVDISYFTDVIDG